MRFIGRHKILTGFGVFLAMIVVAALLFQWDWLIPFVDAQASATLGRPVTITHLHVSLGRTTRIEADGVTIANPDGWPGGGNFATADKLGIDIEPLEYLHGHRIVLPIIDVASPKVDAQQLADGSANWSLGPKKDPNAPASAGPDVQIGTLRISDGHVHVRDAKLRADFNVDLQTKDSADGTGQIVASAKGTYDAKPITAAFVGGALLSLRDADKPYPVDLKLANGPTRVALTGTIQDPLAFKGTSLKLDFAGPDMSLLLALTGLAIPKTPAYHVTGQLDYADGVVTFNHSVGKVGSSDLEGDIAVDTKPQRPVVHATLQSRMVDLKDLGGFIGAQPGDQAKGTKAPVRSNGRVLPSDPISLPRLNATDVHLKYKAARIEGQRQPLENMVANLDIENGNITLKPLSFGIGNGSITSDIALAEKGNELAANANVTFQHIDVDKLLTAAGVGRGAGAISGRAVIQGTGRSVAEILGHGNGELKLFMGRGGDLSALLVDVSGLQFGNAVLSALGIPTRTQIECLILDFPLQQGVLTARTALLDTDSNRVGITGYVNLRDEALKLAVKTESKHFSVGSLPTPIDIDGTFNKPAIAPEAGPLALRGGAAIALGVLGTPLAALLPTIQFGTGEDGACSGLTREIQTPPRVTPIARTPVRAVPVRRAPVRRAPVRRAPVTARRAIRR